MTPEQELQEIVKSWTSATEKRVCAICLTEVDRSTYDQHMSKDHGYEVLELFRTDICIKARTKP